MGSTNSTGFYGLFDFFVEMYNAADGIEQDHAVYWDPETKHFTLSCTLEQEVVSMTPLNPCYCERTVLIGYFDRLCMWTKMAQLNLLKTSTNSVIEFQRISF